MGTVLSVSAVSFSAGTLTSTAHGQVTGNGPVRLLAGSGGVIPTGLAPLTDYWLIVVDANTVKLASSSANAMSNTPVSFSSNGTLPLELLLGIPYTRATTYVAGVSQIKSADLNSFQDALTALWNLLTGQTQTQYSSVNLAVALTIAQLLTASAGITVPTGQNLTLQGTADLKHGNKVLTLPPIGVFSSAAFNFSSGNIGTVSNSASGAVWIPIPLKVGDRIQSADFNHLGSATAFSSVFTIQKLTAAQAQSIVATSGTVSTPTSATWATQTVTVGSPVAIASEECWYAVWQPNATVQGLGAINVTYDHP